MCSGIATTPSRRGSTAARTSSWRHPRSLRRSRPTGCCRRRIEPTPRDLETKIIDVGIEDDIRRNELRWMGLELGMREDEIRALLAQGIAVAERHLVALSIDRK